MATATSGLRHAMVTNSAAPVTINRSLMFESVASDTPTTTAANSSEVSTFAAGDWELVTEEITYRVPQIVRQFVAWRIQSQESSFALEQASALRRGNAI